MKTIKVEHNTGDCIFLWYYKFFSDGKIHRKFVKGTSGGVLITLEFFDVIEKVWIDPSPDLLDKTDVRRPYI